MLSPEQAAAKWRARASTAGDAIKAGVMAMTEADNPLVKAAAAESRWAEGVAEAARQRKFSMGLSRVTFQQWQAAMLGKGLQNYRNGLEAGEQKMAQFLRSFLPYVQQGKDKLRSTPRGTLAQNIERMNIMVNHLANFKRINTSFGFGGIGGGGFGGAGG